MAFQSCFLHRQVQRNKSIHAADLHYLKKCLKNGNNYIFETCTQLVLAGIKVQLDEDGGKIVLSKNTGSMAVMLWPIRF
jgi:hypothetical protein